MSSNNQPLPPLPPTLESVFADTLKAKFAGQIEGGQD